MLEIIKHVLSFKGARDSLLAPADKILVAAVLWLSLLILPLQIYRNFFVEPTPLAVPLLLVALSIIFIGSPLIHPKPRNRLILIGVMLLVFSALVQARNPQSLFGSFHIVTAAILAMLIAGGFPLAMLAVLVNLLAMGAVLWEASHVSPAQLASISVGYAATMTIILGFLAGLLRAYEESENRYHTTHQQLLRNNNDRDRLLQAITLELRNPVSTLKTLTYNANLPPGIAGDLTEVSNDLVEAIEDLRYNLTPEAVDSNVVITDCHIANLLSAVQRQVEPLFADRKVPLERGEIKLPVNAYQLDAGKLRAILTTLLRNAAKRPGLSSASIKVSAEQIGGGLQRLIIVINDDADPISDREREYLTSVTTGNTADHDTGAVNGAVDDAIGLARLQHWLQSMGGTLTYEPNQPKGSRFTIVLHVAPASLQTSRARKMQPVFDTQAMAPLRIAVLESDSLLGRAACTLLRNVGASNVDLYSDGNEFLRALRGGRFYNLIFMDRQIRKSGGHDVLNALRQQGFTNPVIILDPDVTDENTAHDVAQGADASASKPLTMESLATAMKTVAPNTLISAERLATHFR